MNTVFLSRHDVDLSDGETYTVEISAGAQALRPSFLTAPGLTPEDLARHLSAMLARGIVTSHHDVRVTSTAQSSMPIFMPTPSVTFVHHRDDDALDILKACVVNLDEETVCGIRSHAIANGFVRSSAVLAHLPPSRIVSWPTLTIIRK